LPSIRIECPKTHTNFGELFYPGLMVDVWLPSKGYQPFEFILDSGADCTVVPLDMSHLVGYHLPKKPDATISGIINKPIEAYKGEMKLRISNEEFEVRCLFINSNTAPFLLGRLDFFSMFDIHFEGRNSHIILEKV